MDLTIAALCEDEWTNRAEPEVRLRLRKDGTGYYNRAVRGRPVAEKLLYKHEGNVLQFKMAHARSWVSVVASVMEGDGKPGDRYGQRRLTLAKDPYSVAVEDQPGAELILSSDEGASLPSE
ncbi:MAG TPA: hypothetical protein VGK67_14900 [Myxococcales bacterium]|jgi:hypothetical protein